MTSLIEDNQTCDWISRQCYPTHLTVFKQRTGAMHITFEDCWRHWRDCMLICPLPKESPLGSWPLNWSLTMRDLTWGLAKKQYRCNAWGDRFRTLVRNLQYKPYVKTLSIRKYNLCYNNYPYLPSSSKPQWISGEGFIYQRDLGRPEAPIRHREVLEHSVNLGKSLGHSKIMSCERTLAPSYILGTMLHLNENLGKYLRQALGPS